MERWQDVTGSTGATDTDDPLGLKMVCAELLSTLERITKLTERADYLKAGIRKRAAALGGPDTYQAGPHVVTLTPNRRFSLDLATALVPTTVEKAIRLTPVFDRKKFDSMCAPATVEACMSDVGEWRVSVK